MSERDVRLYLTDILESCNAILDYVRDLRTAVKSSVGF